MTTIELAEWQTLTPATEKLLAGASFDGQPAARHLAQQITEQGRLAVYELRHGIELHSTSYVGTILLGDLRVNITPKLDFDVLRTLFRYAYQLRDLHQFDQTTHFTAPATFQDLLIQQLVAEVANLLSRGIHRQYQAVTEPLGALRGRIDLQQVVRRGGLPEARIPCQHHPRSEENPLNATLLAGLHFAATLTADLTLRSRLRRLAKILELSVPHAPLTRSLIDHAQQSVSRLTSAYAPALRLIELLFAGAGLIGNENTSTPLQLPGFLFDMNNFFEALVTRFLKDNLPTHKVQAQHRLAGMMAYHPAHNPRNRRAPTPRPDIALLHNNTVVALLDTKYRDLWEYPLPRDMLYQLAIYALSQAAQPAATILYPTTNGQARLQVVEIREPLWGAQRAQVILRPVHLPTLAHLLTQPGATGARARTHFASELAGQEN